MFMSYSYFYIWKIKLSCFAISIASSELRFLQKWSWYETRRPEICCSFFLSFFYLLSFLSPELVKFWTLYLFIFFFFFFSISWISKVLDPIFICHLLFLILRVFIWWCEWVFLFCFGAGGHYFQAISDTVFFFFFSFFLSPELV